MVATVQGWRSGSPSQSRQGCLRIALAYDAEYLIRMYPVGIVSQREGARMLASQVSGKHPGEHP